MVSFLLSCLSGKILPSILLAQGARCRLENLTDDGYWKEDETVIVNGETVFRKAGDLAPGNPMAGWRRLRKEHPELFANIRVWQQPAAMMDSIIWRWQLDLEASEYRQAIRVTDCCGSVWTSDSKQAAFLLQQANAPVAPGCTTLQQPTDTHLAKPGKDAGRGKKEELREVMRLAALRLNKPVQYQSGKREILLVALAMHDAMVDLNRRTEVVLQAARACGWLAYRPDAEGRMLPADRETWAQVHSQVAGRITAEQLEPRFSWLDEAGKPVMPELNSKAWQNEAEELSKDEKPAQPEPAKDDVNLDTDLVYFDTEAEKQAALLALLHPSRRQDEGLEKQVAELEWYKKELAKRQQAEAAEKKRAEKQAAATPAAKAKSERRRKKTLTKQARKADRELRSDLAAGFRAQLEEAGGSVEKRLAALIPAGKSKAKAKGKGKGKARAAKQKPQEGSG